MVYICFVAPTNRVTWILNVKHNKIRTESTQLTSCPKIITHKTNHLLVWIGDNVQFRFLQKTSFSLKLQQKKTHPV